MLVYVIRTRSTRGTFIFACERAIPDRVLARTSYATTRQNFIIKVTNLHLVSSITQTLTYSIYKYRAKFTS